MQHYCGCLQKDMVLLKHWKSSSFPIVSSLHLNLIVFFGFIIFFVGILIFSNIFEPGIIGRKKWISRGMLSGKRYYLWTTFILLGFIFCHFHHCWLLEHAASYRPSFPTSLVGVQKHIHNDNLEFFFWFSNFFQICMTNKKNVPALKFLTYHLRNNSRVEKL